MKLIIEIDEETYEVCKAWAETATVFSAETKAIATGIPYEERPQGEWIAVYFSREELNVPQKASMFDFVKCPFCETIHQGRHHFCSWCGADMREADNEM